MKTIQQYAQIIENEIAKLNLDKSPLGLYAPIRYALEAGASAFVRFLRLRWLMLLPATVRWR